MTPYPNTLSGRAAPTPNHAVGHRLPSPPATTKGIFHNDIQGFSPNASGMSGWNTEADGQILQVGSGGGYEDPTAAFTQSARFSPSDNHHQTPSMSRFASQYSESSDSVSDRKTSVFIVLASSKVRADTLLLQKHGVIHPRQLHSLRHGRQRIWTHLRESWPGFSIWEHGYRWIAALIIQWSRRPDGALGTPTVGSILVAIANCST